MAVATVGHHPELTKEETFEIFQRHFGDKYEVYPEDSRFRDFAVKKSGWAAVGVRLEQKPGETKFVFGGFTPSKGAANVQAVSFGALSALLAVFLWNSLTNEVKTFIQEAPEFK